MNQKTKLLVAGLLLVGLLGVSGILYGKWSKEAPLTPQSVLPEQSDTLPGSAGTSKAPDFSVTDRDGNTVKLSDYRGKPVVLNFWASWCTICKSEMPDFQEAYEKYGSEVQFLMVNLTNGYHRETKEVARSYIADTGYTFPVFYDESATAADAYAVSSIPVTFFIDEAGAPVAKYIGAFSPGALGAEIEALQK